MERKKLQFLATNFVVSDRRTDHKFTRVKAKFHYAIQVADLVADLVSDLAFDHLATFVGRKQVADRFELSRCRDSSNLSAKGRKPRLRPAREVVADQLAVTG